MTTSIEKTAQQRLTERQLLGFKLNPGTIEDFIGLIADAVQQQRRETVLYHNLHSLYSFFTSERLRSCYAPNKVLLDGMPLIGLLRLFGHDVVRDQRVTYVDFIWPMLEAASENGWKVYHLGQSSEIQQKALQVVRERLPNIQIAGHDGYFDQSADSTESLAVIEQVNAFNADLVLVGFGAPRQEYWVDAHRDKINAATLFTCGACMEYVAGAVKTPPRWMGKLGLEWSYRLFENPRRFAFRYLVEPVLLGLLLLRNLLTDGLASNAAETNAADSHHIESQTTQTRTRTGS